jgi:hypothetical protein
MNLDKLISGFVAFNNFYLVFFYFQIFGQQPDELGIGKAALRRPGQIYLNTGALFNNQVSACLWHYPDAKNHFFAAVR